MTASSPPAQVTVHRRPPVGEVQELLGYQRAMVMIRLFALVATLTQVPAYEEVDLLVLAVAGGLVLATCLVAQVVMLDRRPLEYLRTWSLRLAAADALALYLVSAAFLGSESWKGYLYFPLLGVEVALVGGMRPGIALAVANVLAYGTQEWIRGSWLDYEHVQSMLAIGTMLIVSGVAIAGFGVLAERGRRNLRVLLDLTSALANQHEETETLELLDARLHDAVGGRVRSIAVMDVDGSFQVVRWHNEQRRVLDRAAIDAALGDYERAAAGFRAGQSMTIEVDSWSVATAALGLPEWTRSVTLVPIVTEGVWTGVLPVLWPNAHVPTAEQLRLLYGLAEQMGISIAQGQLRQVRMLAQTDPLTSLLNHRAIVAELRAFTARASRGGSSLAVLFCDLDRFKVVNDTRGHEAGDLLLREIAQAVHGAIRAGDVVGRYGGDELLVVAADTTGEQALVLARRIRDAVAGVATPFGVTVSIGIAVYPEGGTTASALLTAADRAMYEAKRAGGDTASVAGRTSEPDAGIGDVSAPPAMPQAPAEPSEAHNAERP